MPKCYICNFYDPKRMSLFRIPDRNDEYCQRSGLWLKLLEEKSENVHKIRICSDHFLKSNLLQIHHNYIAKLHYYNTTT